MIPVYLGQHQIGNASPIKRNAKCICRDKENCLSGGKVKVKLTDEDGFQWVCRGNLEILGGKFYMKTA